MIKYVTVLLCCTFMCLAVPVPVPKPKPQPQPADNSAALLESIESIQLYQLNDQQTLAEISFRDGPGPALVRNKRTIGMLRTLFPEITKNLDEAVDKILAQLLRVLAPYFLRNGGLNLGGGLTRNSQVSVDLGDDFNDDDDFDFDDDSGNSTTDSTITTTKSADFNNEIDDNNNASSVMDENSLKKKKRAVRSIASAKSSKTDEIEDEEYEDDVAVAGSDNVEKKDSNLSKVDFDDDEDDEDSRNKRYSPNGGGFGVDDTGAGSSRGGGSGNFLFDMLRLVSSGSSSSNPTSSSDGTGLEYGVGKGAGVTSGDAHSFKPIPGPITRLFVLANRSIANLMQDLILVFFKYFSYKWFYKITNLF